MLKAFPIRIVVLIMLIVLAACGGSEPPQAQPTAPPLPQTQTVPTTEPTTVPTPDDTPVPPTASLSSFYAGTVTPVATDVVVAQATAASVPEPTSVPAVATDTPVPPNPTSTSVPAPSVSVVLGAGSLARYIVREQLATLDFPNDAIGETPDVTGRIVFDSEGVVQSELSKITVNVKTLNSDSDKRDNYLRGKSLQSNTFPNVELVVNDVLGLPWPLPDSGTASVQLVGDLTVRGITKPMTWNADLTFDGSQVSGQARTNFTFDVYEMKVPSVFIVISVEDDIRLELDISATIVVEN